MLQDIRDRATGWIAWVVIILIGAAFALFGLSNYMEPGGEARAVATVDGEEISRNVVGQAYRNQRQQIEQQYGSDFEITDEIDQEIRRQALQQLINERLVEAYIDDRNLTISDQDLAAVIRSQEMFHEGGRFSQERYQAILQANQMSSAQYEQHIRRDALAQQLQTALSDTGLVTAREVDELLRLRNQERDVAWLRLDIDAWMEGVEVTDDEVEAYYEDNADSFMAPERVRLSYVELERERMIEQADISDDEIEAYYEEVKAQRFTEDTEFEARHILVRVDEDADDDAVSEATERAQDLYRRISDGESFAELAEEYSEDPGSASQGGDLGRVEPGDMVEEFEEALFSLGEGEVSEPVRSPFGIHIIEATRVSGGEETPLDEVRDELHRELAEERINTEYFDAVNRMDDLAYDTPDGLDDVAEALDLEIQESDWITRDGDGEGIGSEPDIVEAAFDFEVLEDRMNSPVIELGDERAVVVRVRDHEPERQLDLDEVRDEIVERLRLRKAAEEAEAYVDELRARIRDGDDAETLADDDDRLSYESVGWIRREDGEAPWQVMNEVFRMPRPDEDQVRTTMIVASEDPVIVLLRGVRDGDPEDYDQEERQELADQLRSAYGREAVEQFLAQLRADADVEIHDEDYR